MSLLKLQNQEQVKNTWWRSPKVLPHLEKTDNEFIIKTINLEVRLGKLEEVILYIISSFKYLPIWLVQRWYEDIKGVRDIAIRDIISWINVGLVWSESSTTGTYLRPTKFLLDLFKEENTSYMSIPFNTLTHNISEAQVIFEIMMGYNKSELWFSLREESLLPCFHPILDEYNLQEEGTLVVRETSFRQNYKASRQSLIDIETEIELGIKAKEDFTAEFDDFKKFPIIYTDMETGEISTQNPDLIIPVPRKYGQPKSIAIEIELTAKDNERYKNILKAYKDNNRFGKLYYLCENQRIMKMVKEAFNGIGGLGKCELFILPFNVPTTDIENFSRAAQAMLMKTIKETLEKTE